MYTYSTYTMDYLVENSHSCKLDFHTPLELMNYSTEDLISELASRDDIAYVSVRNGEDADLSVTGPAQAIVVIE